MGSGGVAIARIGTGEFTLAPSPGLVIDKGKPQSAAAGGWGAGGTIDVLAGAVGVVGQLATFFGRPSQPASAPKINPSDRQQITTLTRWPLMFHTMVRISP